jgi:hypothetical protein
MFILLARADFRLLTESDAVPKLAPTITTVFAPRIFRLTRVTRIFQKSVFSQTTRGSLFRCGRLFGGPSARDDCLAPP